MEKYPSSTCLIAEKSWLRTYYRVVKSEHLSGLTVFSALTVVLSFILVINQYSRFVA